MRKYNDLKESVCESNLELVKKGLVIHTFGNVSTYDNKNGVIGIKPSGIPYHKLTTDKIVIIDLNNKVVEGNLEPSSDTKTHTLLYKKFPNIGGIAHTHSTYATSWAQAKMSIPCLGTTHADYVQGPILCTADEAVINMILLEEIARMAWLTIGLNPHIDELKKDLLDKHYLRKHGQNAYYGQKNQR